MILESQFLYRYIGAILFHAIVDAIVQKRRSHVLLGARNAGKRYIMHRLPDRLRKAGAQHVVAIDFHRDTPWQSEAELTEFIKQNLRAIPRSTGGQEQEDTEGQNTLKSCLDDACSHFPGLVLLASGVDELGPHLSLLFVQTIRTLVQASSPRLTVVLTGEVNFQDLVHGPGSAFENCAQQIFVQGYDKDEFAEVALTRGTAANFAPTASDIDRLFTLTGGQLHLLSPLLSAWQELVSSHAAKQNPGNAKETFFRQVEAPGAHGLDLLQHSEYLIGHNLDEWARLEKLIRDEAPIAGFNRPGPLEFAGLAVRDEHARLHFCSPLVAQSVRRYFHDRRRGDWHAHVGRWTEALSAYERIEPALRLRPSGPDDRAITWELIRNYSSHLYSLASLPAEKAPQQRLRLRVAFQRGLKLLLGVHCISFWRRSDVRWQSIAPMDHPVPRLADVVTKFLPPRLQPVELSSPLGWVPLSSPHDEEYMMAFIASERDDQPEALVISEAGSGHVLTRERQSLVRELGNVFLKAYEHLSSVARAITCAEQRRKFEEVAATALSGIDSQTAPSEILKAAAEALRPLGYKRLLFSLVDSTGTRIVGEIDASSNPAINVAEQTDYPVDRPDSDIQAWVVHHKQSKRVAEPLKEPGVKQSVVEAANIGPFALLPLLGQNGDAVGTLHVEREDGSLPTREEVEDFVSFGRRLSIAIERCERVSLYEPALQLLRDPVMIIDPLNRVRFANKAAHDEFGVREGWHGKREAMTTRHVFDPDADKMIFRLIESAQEKSQRSVRYMNEVGIRKRTMAVIAQPISIGGGKTTRVEPAKEGVLLHFRDHHYQWIGFDHLNKLNVEITLLRYLERLLELPKRLGHKWARLWLTEGVLAEDVSAEQLNQSDVFGFASYHDDDAELHAIFKSMPGLRLSDPESVKAIRNGCVVVYECVDEEKKSYTTTSGLEVTPFPQPPHSDALKRRNGDMWINFPLRSSEGKLIGLMSMDVPNDFRARNVEDLRMMAQIISSRLTNLLESRHLKAASERVITDVSHELIARLAPLELLVSRCDMLAQGNADLLELSDDLAGFAVRCLCVLRDIKDAYVVPPVERRSIHLRGWLKRWVTESGWGQRVEVKDGDTFEAQVDPRHLERALLELLKNARDFAQTGVPLKIEIDTGVEMVNDRQDVWITVRDNGVGIPAAKRRLIFSDFYSYRPGTDASTGMGLAGAERQLKAHGGSITAEGLSIADGDPPEHAGAVFRLTWPNTHPESASDSNIASNASDQDVPGITIATDTK